MSKFIPLLQIAPNLSGTVVGCAECRDTMLTGNALVDVTTPHRLIFCRSCANIPEFPGEHFDGDYAIENPGDGTRATGDRDY